MYPKTIMFICQLRHNRTCCMTVNHVNPTRKLRTTKWENCAECLTQNALLIQENCAKIANVFGTNHYK